MELSREEMKRVDPQFDEDWRTHFRDVLNQIRDRISTRVYNIMFKSLYYSLEDPKMIRCFHKDGRLLSFEEWIEESNFVLRATMLNGVGTGTAEQLQSAYRRYKAEQTVTFV